MKSRVIDRYVIMSSMEMFLQELLVCYKLCVESVTKWSTHCDDVQHIWVFYFNSSSYHTYPSANVYFRLVD